MIQHPLALLETYRKLQELRGIQSKFPASYKQLQRFCCKNCVKVYKFPGYNTRE